MSKILALTFIAGIAGLAVWAVTEPFAPAFGDDQRWAFFGVWFWFLLFAFIIPMSMQLYSFGRDHRY